MSNIIYTKKIKSEIESINKDTISILNPVLELKYKNISLIEYSDNIATTEDILSFLEENKVSVENILPDVVQNNNPNNNLITYSILDKLNFMGDILKKSNISTKMSIKKLLLLMDSEYNEESIIKTNYFFDNYYIKTKTYRDFKTNISSFDLELINCNIESINSGLTIEELLGSGSKISDFIIDTEYKEKRNQITEIYFKYLPINHVVKISVDGYKVEEDVDNSLKLDELVGMVIDDLGLPSEFNIEQMPGYLSATPIDDDNEYKIGLYSDFDGADTIKVSFQENNKEEHDIEVEWDDKNGELTVTYASDGEDPIYPTIGELKDAIENSSPIKLDLIDTDNYTLDDEFIYSMDFEMNRYDSKIVVSSNKSFNVFTDSYETQQNIQEFQDGQNLSGHVECISFRRGIEYFIDIDGEKYAIDTQDNNNEDVVDCKSLMDKFYDYLSESENIEANIEVVENTIYISFLDDANHNVTTSGDNGFVEPVKRAFKVLVDFDNYLKIESLKDNSPTKVDFFKPNTISNTYDSFVSELDLKSMLEDGIIINKNAISRVFIVDDLGNRKKDFNKTDVSIVRRSVENISNNKQLFLQEKLSYFFKSTIYSDKKIELPVYEKDQLDYIVRADKHKIAAKKQVFNFNNIDSKYFEINYLKQEQSNFIKNVEFVAQQNIKQVRDLIEFSPTKQHNYSFFKFKNTLKQVLITKEKIDKDTYSIIERFLLTGDIVFNDKIEKIKTAIFQRCLSLNSDLLLQQIITLIDKYQFSFSDLVPLYTNDVFRDIVMEFGVEDSNEDDGIEVKNTDESLTFKDLYIRQYKKQFEADGNKDLSKFWNDEKIIANLPLYTKIVPIAKQEENGLTYLGDGVYNPKIQQIEYNEFDKLLFDDSIKTLFNPFYMNDLINRASFGVSENGSIWEACLIAINIIDDTNIVDVGRALDIVRLFYSKLENVTPEKFALLLSRDKIHISSNTDIYNSSALFELFKKIKISSEINNIEFDDNNYDNLNDYFNKVVGIIFMDDETQSNILPFDLYLKFIKAETYIIQ